MNVPIVSAIYMIDLYLRGELSVKLLTDKRRLKNSQVPCLSILRGFL